MKWNVVLSFLLFRLHQFIVSSLCDRPKFVNNNDMIIVRCRFFANNSRIHEPIWMKLYVGLVIGSQMERFSENLGALG